MVELFSKVIKSRKLKSKEVTKGFTDILQVFIEMVYKEDQTKLTDDQIVGLLIALLFAGQHTSSITSTWTSMFLAHNKDCLKKVLDEQQALLGADNANKTLDFDTVNKMDYLQNCVKESLRLHPPLIMLMRLVYVAVVFHF